MKNKIQLDATYYFIMLMLGSTCFGHHYAHHQDLTTIGRMDECPDRRLLQPSVRTLINRRAETERDGTRAETRFGFPAKRTSPFISAGVSVQSAAGSRGVRISSSNAG